MNRFKAIKVIGCGLLAFVARFMVGGILFQGVKMNPQSFAFGFLVSMTALVAAYVLLKLVIKPQTTKEALGIAMVWMVIALLLDVVTARPIVGVTATYLLPEIQTWTRLLVILLIAPFTVHKTNTPSAPAVPA